MVDDDRKTKQAVPLAISLIFGPAPSRHAPCITVQQSVERAAASNSGTADGGYFNSATATEFLVVDRYGDGQAFAGGESNDSSEGLSCPPHKVSPIPAAGKNGFLPGTPVVVYALPFFFRNNVGAFFFL